MIDTQVKPNYTACIGATTKYYGPTNTKGSRIKVYSWYDGSCKFYSYDYGASCPHKAAFEQWVTDMYPNTEYQEVAFVSDGTGQGYNFMIIG